MEENKTIEGIVARINEPYTNVIGFREHTYLIIKYKPGDLEDSHLCKEIPRIFSRQEKELLLGKRIKYVEMKRSEFSTEYELKILEEPFKNWRLNILATLRPIE